MNRRESLAVVAGAAATLAGCSGFASSSSDSSTTPAADGGEPEGPRSGSTRDPETLRVWTATDRRPLWLADPDAENGGPPDSEPPDARTRLDRRRLPVARRPALDGGRRRFGASRLVFVGDQLRDGDAVPGNHSGAFVFRTGAVQGLVATRRGLDRLRPPRAPLRYALSSRRARLRDAPHSAPGASQYRRGERLLVVRRGRRLWQWGTTRRRRG